MELVKQYLTCVLDADVAMWMARQNAVEIVDFLLVLRDAVV